MCRLDLYHDAAVLYTLDKGVITSRVVSARDITLAILSSVPLQSAILPENALWWAQGKKGIEVGIWRPPKVWPVAVMVEAFKPPLRLRLPMPGLIFVCSRGRPPRVYAAKKRPTRELDTVYHAPLFNIFSDGRTCPGTHHYPEKVGEIPESFFASFFTREAQAYGRSRKYPDDLFKLWQELDGKARYPVKDLVPIGPVGDIMR
jgi:PRTRC genetic system protein B